MPVAGNAYENNPARRDQPVEPGLNDDPDAAVNTDYDEFVDYKGCDEDDDAFNELRSFVVLGELKACHH